ncbi:MAG: hypothetical protein C4523_00930 [Myxococcales bacterium]|nr:MAG: hypothetical protein C4523_00930 [Myxococcales bacterium]
MPGDMKHVRPYGDTLGDGAVQLSFTLPLPCDDRAQEAARQLVEKMGFTEAQIVHRADLGESFSFFVAYGKTTHTIDAETVVVPKVDSPSYTMAEINALIEREFGRKLSVVGACTGSDAHTVGIDAIMNMKGYNHHYGLERYPRIEAVNLGSQVPNEELIRFAIKADADAVLVSQVVTQKDAHVANLTQFIELANSYGIRERMLLIVGGPRITHKLALELGFDAGFGPGAYAEHVASFIIEQLLKRR